MNSNNEKLDALLEKGRQEGKLTAKDLDIINDINPEALNRFYEQLALSGVELSFGTPDIEDNPTDTEPLPESLPSEDPVRAYQSEIGKVPLLTPEEEQLFRSINQWFKDHLPEPEPCKNHEAVITFFKCAGTEEMVKKLEPAVRLLDRYNRPYDVVYTNFVGTVVYEDDWQVAVAVSGGKMV